MGGGVLGIEVRETVGFGTGTKIDAGVSQKGSQTRCLPGRHT